MSEHEEFPTYIHLNEYSNAVSWADDPDSMAIDSTEYIRTDIVEKMLKEQRNQCAKDSSIALFNLNPAVKTITAAYVVEQACLNAVEKEV